MRHSAAGTRPAFARACAAARKPPCAGCNPAAAIAQDNTAITSVEGLAFGPRTATTPGWIELEVQAHARRQFMRPAKEREASLPPQFCMERLHLGQVDKRSPGLAKLTHSNKDLWTKPREAEDQLKGYDAYVTFMCGAPGLEALGNDTGQCCANGLIACVKFSGALPTQWPACLKPGLAAGAPWHAPPAALRTARSTAHAWAHSLAADHAA